MKRLLTLGAYIALISLPEGLMAQAGPAYRLQGNSIRVDRVSHWNNWIYQNDLVTSLNAPVGGVNILEVGAGGLRPVFFRRNVNVAPTAADFIYKDQVRAQGDSTRGGTSAKSNAGLADNVIDGDLTTFWEPATPADYPSRLDAPGHFHLDGLREWEVEIDLGRLVFADSLTFIFPSDQFEGEFLGQPVKAFAVFASMGERFPFPLGNNLRFTLVAQASTGVVGADGVELVPVPGTEGRYAQMTFGLVPLDRADWDLDGIPDISGTFLQYIRFKSTASDLWRDAFLGSGEEARLAYEALPAERRGAVIYQRLTAGGLLVDLRDDGNQTAREKHQALPEAKRGPILYYVKEVPRLAEVQVWTRGDNYAYQPESRAGDSFEHGGLGAPELATDGNYDTEWAANTWSPVYVKGTAWYDLGAVFWVDNLSVVNKRINQSNHGAFIGPGILVSDGTLLKPVAMEDRGDFTQLEDGLQWHNIIGEEKLTNRTSKVRIFQEDFPLRKIRFLQIRDLDITGSSSGQYGALATLAEFQLFGEGYPVSVWAYSPPIALTDSRGEFVRKTLPRIRWDGDILVRETDPLTGESVERFEPLHSDPDVRLQVQTRTSDQTDSLFTYFEVVSVAGSEERTEVTKDRHDQIAMEWAAWEYWQTLPSDQRHASRHDDDGDGLEDEDHIDFQDNDGDGLVDEDGKKLRRAPRSTFARDGELAFVGWSSWSESYLPTNGLSEATITSPNPRKFIQVRVNILSEDPLKTARIRSLRIDLAPPVALELVGELALLSDDGAGRALTDLDVLPTDYTPPTGIDPLEPQRFAYFIRSAGPDPTVRGGFDEVLITTPRAARLTGVRLGRVEVARRSSALDPEQEETAAVATRFDNVFAPGGDGVFRNEAGQVLEQMAAGADSVWVRFPSSVNTGLPGGEHALIEVQFESQSFREGIEYTSFVRSSDSEDVVFQRVDIDSRDATELVASSTTRVGLAELEGPLIQDVALAQVFTPNGDGVNDELPVSFALLKVLQERPLEVEFFDLGGRLVGRGLNTAGAPKAGYNTFTWDGRDPGGRLVPPGIYLCRIKVEADAEDSQFVRLVHVAY